MLGKFGAVALATSLVIGAAASAAEGANKGALPGAGAAGVQNAISWQGHNHLLWLVGGGVVIGGIVLIATGNGHGGISNCTLPGCTPPTTTTTTSPTTTTATSTSTSTTTTTTTTTGTTP